MSEISQYILEFIKNYYQNEEIETIELQYYDDLFLQHEVYFKNGETSILTICDSKEELDNMLAKYMIYTSLMLFYYTDGLPAEEIEESDFGYFGNKEKLLEFIGITEDEFHTRCQRNKEEADPESMREIVWQKRDFDLFNEGQIRENADKYIKNGYIRHPYLKGKIVEMGNGKIMFEHE